VCYNKANTSCYFHSKKQGPEISPGLFFLLVMNFEFGLYAQLEICPECENKIPAWCRESRSKIPVIPVSNIFYTHLQNEMFSKGIIPPPVDSNPGWHTVRSCLLVIIFSFEVKILYFFQPL
jgi:hypothetical protein